MPGRDKPALQLRVDGNAANNCCALMPGRDKPAFADGPLTRKQGAGGCTLAVTIRYTSAVSGPKVLQRQIMSSLPSYAMNQPTFPEMYEQWLVGPLFRPWAELTLDEVNLASGDRLLDIACGTGIVARVAKERLGEGAYIVGIDVSPDMLAVARRAAPNIDWRQGNAAALPLQEGEQFNVVVCHQGLQFFPDKPAAVAQMRRALVPGGTLAISTRRSDDEIPFFRERRRIAERHLGPIADQRHSFGDAAQLEAVLRDAGFGEGRSRRYRG